MLYFCFCIVDKHYISLFIFLLLLLLLATNSFLSSTLLSSIFSYVFPLAYHNANISPLLLALLLEHILIFSLWLTPLLLFIPYLLAFSFLPSLVPLPLLLFFYLSLALSWSFPLDYFLLPMSLFVLFTLALSMFGFHYCSLLLSANLVSNLIHLPFLYFCLEHALE